MRLTTTRALRYTTWQTGYLKRIKQIGIDRAEREGCLLPERQEDGSRRKQKIIFYMKGWLQNVKTKYL